MIDSIYQAQKIKVLLESLKNQKKTLSVPELTEQSFIPMLYDWFNEIEEERSCPPYPDSVNQRKKFCFIVLRLYSPGTILFGDHMTEGLRVTLSTLFQIKSGTSISDYCYDIIFLYKNYKETRDMIDSVYNRIVQRLSRLDAIFEV